MPSDMRAIDCSAKDPIDDRLEGPRDDLVLEIVLDLDLDLDLETISDSEESEKSCHETKESFLFASYLRFGFLLLDRPLSTLLSFLLAPPGGAEWWARRPNLGVSFCTPDLRPPLAASRKLRARSTEKSRASRALFRELIVCHFEYQVENSLSCSEHLPVFLSWRFCLARKAI
jgi:hypothetical protein